MTFDGTSESSARSCARCGELEGLLEKYKTNQQRSWKEVSSILAGIPLGLVIANKEREIEATNSQIRELSGYGAEDLFGEVVSLIFPKLEQLEISARPQKLKLVTQDNRAIQVEVSINNLDWEGAKKWLIHVKDLSEEQRLLEYKMNIAAILSHDIRTPLSTMRSVLELLHDGNYGEISEDGDDAISWALASSDYAHVMLANLLENERLDSNSVECNPIETSTGKIVESAVQLCKLFAESNKIRIESGFSNEVFLADQGQIVQILVNLISNAVKFSEPGQSVRVNAGLEGLKIKFTVSDNGPGVPEALQEKIFDKFEQLGIHKKEKQVGFGLGLAIARALAELNKGKLTLRSTKSKGTTFELSIPYAESS